MSAKTPRAAAIIGPYLSGKTTLLESILNISGAISRKGSVKEKNSVGDSSPEARNREMSTEVNVATTNYLGDNWSFIDCPGSVELLQESLNALMVVDAAVVVCEPLPDKALALAPLLKFLDEHSIPHIIFINKMDIAQGQILKPLFEALQKVSDRPLVLREIPLKEGDNIVGYIDLASEKAYRYRTEDQGSLVAGQNAESESEARREMLEHLADFDDHLLEELLEEISPPAAEVYENLARDLQGDLIVPVFFGSALNDQGIRRLLKSLRHDVPEVATAMERNGIKANGPKVQIFKTLHPQHTGKLSLARVWGDEITDGMSLDNQRVSGLYSLLGSQNKKLAKAIAGDVVALGRLDNAQTGQILTPAGQEVGNWPDTLKPLFSLAVNTVKKGDDVKLSASLAKLIEEDPSLKTEHDPDTNELVIWGQGDIHLQIAAEKLKSKFGLEVAVRKPTIPYKETIKKGTTQHGRYKRQTGGHGQFGDVHIEITPLPRGSGFQFNEKIVGGVVPRQYFSSVEVGAREYLSEGPLGFPVLDVGVTLFDGSYHNVDSSDMAFKMATRLAMNEGMPKCEPVLLEPILHVGLAVPAEHTSKAQRLLSSRRAQILGFNAKDGWDGWDVVEAHLPQAEMHDMIIELRSLTQGVGTFAWRFDHLQELTGKPAERVVETRKQQLQQSR